MTNMEGDGQTIRRSVVRNTQVKWGKGRSKLNVKWNVKLNIVSVFVSPNKLPNQAYRETSLLVQAFRHTASGMQMIGVAVVDWQ